MKKFRIFLLTLLIIPCVFLFSACTLNPNSDLSGGSNKFVTGIELKSSNEEKNIYTITYSDGTTSTFEILNGTNGKDGENGKLTVEDLRQYCEEKGLDFDEYLRSCLNVDYTTNQINNISIVNQGQSVKDGVNKALQSAVSVWSEFPVSSYGTEKKTVSCGAGVIYKMDSEYCYLITNFHVVYYASSSNASHIATNIHVFQYGTSESISKSTDETTITYGDGAVECEYIGGSMNYDIAVLKAKTDDLKKYNPNLAAVTVAEKYSLADTCMAIGNPECEGLSVTQGIVSVVSETIKMTKADEDSSNKALFRVMRIDTAVNGGNSGGGLFNVKGELIGIVNAKVIDSEIDNIAYALPYNNVTKVADNILYYYNQNNQTATVKQLYFGVTYTTVNSKAVYNPETNETTIYDEFRVESVSNGYYAEACGLQVGDIVTAIKINDETTTITRSFELCDILITIRENDKVTLTIKRNDQTLNLNEITVTNSMMITKN